MKLRDLSYKLRNLLGDGTMDISDEFIISAFNYAITDLPMVPRLEKLFSVHKQFNLDAKGHYRWNLNYKFRRLNDITMINFYTSTGGEPCRLPLCRKSVTEFYDRNGLVSMKKAGVPCEYTIEVEGDDVWLVLDRPSSVPIIVDYIAYGYPKTAESLGDDYDISAIAESLILGVMKGCYLQEASDYAFAADVTNYLDNKKVIEAEQQLHRQWGDETLRILGEA